MSLTELVASLRDQGEAVNRGDLAAAERMLSAQAVALNAVFSEMARRAALNMGTNLGATEAYMRLALKAQSQSRARWRRWQRSRTRRSSTPGRPTSTTAVSSR